MRFTVGRSELGQALFTWTGVVPTGAFLALHLLRVGSDLPRVAVATWLSTPLLAAELLLVWLPLALHAVYGFGIVLGRAAAPSRSCLRTRWARGLLRGTGVLSAGAIVAHAVHVRWPVLRGAWLPSDVHARMIDALATTTAQGVPLAAAAHLLGTAVLVAHFTQGLFVALAERRIPNHVSRDKLLVSCAWGGVVLFALGALAVLRLATGSPLPWPLPAADFRP